MRVTKNRVSETHKQRERINENRVRERDQVIETNSIETKVSSMDELQP